MQIAWWWFFCWPRPQSSSYRYKSWMDQTVISDFHFLYLCSWFSFFVLYRYIYWPGGYNRPAASPVIYSISSRSEQLSQQRLCSGCCCQLHIGESAECRSVGGRSKQHGMMRALSTGRPSNQGAPLADIRMMSPRAWSPTGVGARLNESPVSHDETARVPLHQAGQSVSSATASGLSKLVLK